ncbi:HNH endonuclease signature motif containing protein [Citricoccus sp. K5]|uniref:HNH endonuclease signature motif containing protein n=1 Tax=Citricoccus sp. K5 TaxID=2653135 RepID=UPI0012F14623|nr:HNH endonuclease signature motif containing protein [Citricoccus sp. K5]VXB69846.1 conserved hypothetical protein [Citricoccus sp. K5]
MTDDHEYQDGLERQVEHKNEQKNEHKDVDDHASGTAPLPSLNSLDELPLGHLTALLQEATRAVVHRLSGPDALREFTAMAVPEDSGGRDWGAMLSSLPDEPDSDAAPGLAVASVPDPNPVLPPVLTGDASTHADAVTLPVLHQVLETVGRSVATAQMTLTGHTVEAFDNPPERRRLLGLPQGKTAFRDATDYLKLALRIDGTEARRRTRWAASLRPTRALTGESLPPALPLLSAAVHEGKLDRAAVDVITTALDNVRQMARRVEADPQTVSDLLDDGEERLVAQAESVDPGTLRKVAAHWLRWVEAAVDPDGSEPNDATLPQLQGLIRKGERNGLHQWLLAVNDEQNEYLLTVANAATNPRASYRGPSMEGAEGSAAGSEGLDQLLTAEVQSEEDGSLTAVTAVDPRSTQQKQLDGLMACIAGGLAMIESDQLPSTGGTRPQVSVLIDFHTLLGDLQKAGTVTAEDLLQFESSATFTGPIHPGTIRAMACDADILPVVLGSSGEVLDVGRAQRLFPARLRQAVAARDGGCAAPGCWIPAPWCDVHHVEHWEHGGPTSVDNGVLLCNHHHHAVHAGAWDIDMDSGRPWFIPAPYLDPRRQPQRNRFWRR